MSRASKLRALLQDGMVVAPGAYDCITARTIAQAGFPAVYMTGAGTAATLAARSNPDFLIIARTDSRAVLGLEEAIRRVNAALAAGADVAFVEAPQTMEEVAAVPKLVKGPCLFNNVWRGKSPDVAHDEAQRLGYKITIVPGMLFKAVLGVCDQLLKQMKEKGRHPILDTGMT